MNNGSQTFYEFQYDSFTVIFSKKLLYESLEMVRNITLPTKSPLPNPCNQSKIIKTSRDERIFFKSMLQETFTVIYLLLLKMNLVNHLLYKNSYFIKALTTLCFVILCCLFTGTRNSVGTRIDFGR